MKKKKVKKHKRAGKNVLRVRQWARERSKKKKKRTEATQKEKYLR